jgi:two-component system alkaline phosphatase synthesis response regulator PhoP
MPVNVPRAAVLVVDDEEMIRSVLRLTLVRAGYDVTEAESGEDALSKVQEELPDLILLDVMMPGMDGFAVCEQLRQSPDTADLPIIMLSARSDSLSRQKGRRVGATKYLTKPLEANKLLQHVEEALEKTNKQRYHGTT